jgi:beta-lactamase regulating signal transducer with metallopeptidase domain
VILEGTLTEAVRALGWTLIHTLWQGALVAVGYAAFRGFAGRCDVRLRYAGGMVALALMLLLPLATLWRLLVGGAAPLAAAAAPDAGAAAAGWAARIEAWLPLLVLAWGLGVLVMGLREAWRYRAVRALLLGSAIDLGDWTARAARIAVGLRVSRPVRVVCSTLARTPSLVGWLKPVVVLPASALFALSPRQLEMVIAHELAHVRRADYLVNLLQVAVETLLFHHPAVHWISREVRELREACCDDLVLRSGVDPLHYADTIASLAELRGITHAPAMAATGGALLLRVERIVGVGGETPARLDGQAVVLVAGLLALALMLARHEPPVDPAPVAATPAVAVAQRAVAIIGASLAPSAPVAPVATPSRAVAPASRAGPAVERLPAPARRVVSADPAVAAPAPPKPPAPPELPLALDAGIAAPALAVADVHLKRREIRPLMVIVNDPPITCVRSVGSRLCRALPQDGTPEAAALGRTRLDDGRSAAQDVLLRARASDPFGR